MRVVPYSVTHKRRAGSPASSSIEEYGEVINLISYLQKDGNSTTNLAVELNEGAAVVFCEQIDSDSLKVFS